MTISKFDVALSIMRYEQKYSIRFDNIDQLSEKLMREIQIAIMPSVELDNEVAFLINHMPIIKKVSFNTEENMSTKSSDSFSNLSIDEMISVLFGTNSK